MGTIDLDAARAAREQAEGKGHILRFGRRNFTLPTSPPFGLASAFDDAQGEKEILAALELLLGEQFPAFMALRPTWADYYALMARWGSLYGLGSLGEAPASNGSSSTNGSGSRPRSKPATKSTSPKRASARKR